MSYGKGLNSLISPGSRRNNTYPPAGGQPHILHDEIQLAPIVRKDPPRNTSPRNDSPRPIQESVFHIETEKIRPNPYQPRTTFSETELEELAHSIREFGVLQPIVVTKVVRETDTGTKVEYQLIAGERRLMAAKRAGLERIPAIVRKGDSSKLKFELALIENIQRSDLNAMESARAYQRLQEEFGLTQKDVASRVGKSRETVANTMRLLGLPDYLQEALKMGKITESHARQLVSLPVEQQKAMYESLLQGGISAKHMRERIREAKTPNPEIRHLERKLEEKFGLPSSISRNGKKGKISIQFYSEEEYKTLLNQLLGEGL